MESPEGGSGYPDRIAWKIDRDDKEKGYEPYQGYLFGPRRGRSHAFFGFRTANQIDSQPDQRRQANASLHCNYEAVHAVSSQRYHLHASPHQHRRGRSSQLRREAGSSDPPIEVTKNGLAADPFKGTAEVGKSANLCKPKIDLLGNRSIHLRFCLPPSASPARRQEPIRAHHDNERLQGR